MAGWPKLLRLLCNVALGDTHRFFCIGDDMLAGGDFAQECKSLRSVTASTLGEHKRVAAAKGELGFVVWERFCCEAFHGVGALLKN